MSQITIVRDRPDIGPGFVECRVSAPNSKFNRLQQGINNNNYSWDTVLREAHRDYDNFSPQATRTYSTAGYTNKTFIASRAEVESHNQNPLPIELVIDEGLKNPINPVVIEEEEAIGPSIEAAFTAGNSASDRSNDYTAIDIPNSASNNNVLKFRVIGSNEAPTVVSNVSWLSNIRVTLAITGDKARLYNVTYNRASNESASFREGVLTATVEGVTGVLTLTQPAPAPFLDIPTNVFSFGSGGFVTTFQWTTRYVEVGNISRTENIDWADLGVITLTGSTILGGTNRGATARTGVITITATNTTGTVSRTITINQAAGQALLWVQARSGNWASYDKHVESTNASNAAWGAYAFRGLTNDNVIIEEAPNVDWLTLGTRRAETETGVENVDPDVPQAGDFTVFQQLFSVTRNTSRNADRSTFLRLRNRDSSISLNLFVIQERRLTSSNNWISGGRQVMNNALFDSNANVVVRNYTFTGSVISREVVVTIPSSLPITYEIVQDSPFDQTISIRYTRTSRITVNGTINLGVNATLNNRRTFNNRPITVTP